MTTGTLSSQTKIQVGLAITLICAAGGLYAMVYTMNDALRAELTRLGEKIETRYISRELFDAKFDALAAQNDAKAATLSKELSELKSEVRAFHSMGPSNR